jgi:hypothetical protein
MSTLILTKQATHGKQIKRASEIAVTNMCANKLERQEQIVSTNAWQENITVPNIYDPFRRIYELGRVAVLFKLSYRIILYDRISANCVSVNVVIYKIESNI